MATDKAKPDKFWISRIKNLNVFNMAWPDNCSRVMMRCGCADLYFGWKAKAPLLPSPEYRPPLQKLNTPMDAIAKASSWCAIQIAEEKGDVGKLDECQWLLLLLEDQYQYWQCWQYQYLTDVKYTMQASLYDVYVESITLDAKVLWKRDTKSSVTICIFLSKLRFINHIRHPLTTKLFFF